METLKGRIGLIVFFMLMAGGASGKIAPEQDRLSFHTAHFRFHYPSHYRTFTENLSVSLEEAFGLLSRDLGWSPEGKTEVVVRGDSDVPGGVAEVFPYNRLVIQAVPPEPFGFFSESDDWIRTLAIHELTHIIANDETSGLFRFLRSFIGTAAKVNPYQPSWLIEGLAVYEETRLTGAGRGRSVWNQMITRQAVHDENFSVDGPISLDRLNDGVPYWPAGNTPYLYGYLLVEAIAETGGAKAPFEISNLNSGRLPFLIDGVARSRLGKNYSEIWRGLVEKIGTQEKSDWALLSKTPPTPTESLTSIGRRTRGAAPFTGGARKDDILFIRDSRREGVGLSHLHAGAVKNLNEWRWDGGTRVRAVPDGNGAGYSKIIPFREHSLYSELFYYDLDRSLESQLTEGARAADPDFSPDFKWDPAARKISGGKIVFVKNLPDGNQAIATWDGENEDLLFAGEHFERIATPVYGSGKSSDWIAFSEKSRTTGEKIRAIQISTRKVFDRTTPESARDSAITPEWDAHGNLLFASGRGGVFNLYRVAPGKNPVRVTHVTGGLIQPVSVGENRVIALEYGPNGFNLARLPLSPPGLPPLSELTTLREKISGAPPGVSGESNSGFDPNLERSATAYSVLPALLPHYWGPDLRRVSDGWTLGIQTGSVDAWESHRYRLFGAYDTRTTFPLVDINYQYDGLFPTFEFSLRQENRYFANYRESNRIRTGALRAYIPAGWDTNFIVGGTASTSRFFGGEESSSGFELGWSLRRMVAYDDSIDREGESGVALDAGITGYFAGEERYSSIRSLLELRIPSPVRRHFLRIAVDYAHANNDRIEALYFLGGGEETIAANREFLFRGYDPGTVFGREILTSNFEYHFPVADIFHGWGTFPAYFERARVKLFMDVASAEYVGTEQRSLKRWPSGAGIHFLNDFNLLYRVPVTIAFGFDRGFSPDLGGETRFVLGLYSRLK